MDMLTGMLGILMRAIHIGAMAMLLGGAVYARFVASEEVAGERATERRFGVWLTICIALLFGSGLYNLLTKSAYPPHYHMWFGIKFLLALHVFAAAAMLARGRFEAAKRARILKGLVISGGVIVLLSAYLRWMTLHV